MNRLLVVVAVMLTMSCKPLHAALQPNPTPVQQRVLEYTSGLRVIAENHPGTGRVALAMLVGAGSTNDPRGLEGAAHFIEHLAFRSRPTQRLTLWDELDFAGVGGESVTVNASTTFDTTSFLGLVPSDKLANALPLFTSLVVRPLVGIDDATLEVERAVVRNEQLERGHGGGQYLAALGTAVFGEGSSGSRPVSGDARSIAALTRADLEAFVTQHYVPSATTLVLVGDLAPEQVDALVRRAFPPAWLETHTRVAPRTLATQQPRATAIAQRPVVEADVSRRELVFAWAVPGAESPAGSAMELLKNEFRHATFPKESGVKTTWTQFLPLPSQSILLLGVELEPGADLEKVRVELISQGAFWQPKQNDARRLAIDELRREQDLLTHAASRANRAFATGQTGLKRLGVSEEGWKELERVRTELLTWERSREVLVVPRVATLDTAPRLQAVTNANPRNVTVSRESLRALALPLPLGEVRSFTLENGLQVVLSRRGPVPYASATLTLPLGARFGTNVSREVLPVMLDFQTRRHDTFARVGEPDVFVGADATTLSLSGPSWELPLMLDVLGHNLTPDVPWNRVLGIEYFVQTFLERQAERPVEKEAGISTSPEPLLRDVLPPGSRQLDPTNEEFKDLERAQFTQFVDRAFVPAGASLVVTGDFEFAPTEVVVRELFDGWRGKRALPKERQLGPLPSRPARPRVIEVPEATQTEVRFACRLPAAETLEERGGQELLANALAQVLEDELRRERGGTYGVHAWTTGYQGEPNVLWLEAKLDARDRQATLARFLERLDELYGTVWEEQTVDRARWRLARSHLNHALTSKEASVMLGTALALGHPLADAKDLTWKLSTVPLRAVDDAWTECFESAAFELRGHQPTIDAVLKRRLEKGKP